MSYSLIGQTPNILTNDSEHHMHDGPDLCVPLGLLLAAQHPVHQAGGDVAPGEPGLPVPHHHNLHHTPGQ